MRFRDRGVAGISLGGSEHRFPPAPFARAFAIAREGGLKAAPHAGETAGPASIRSALDDLHADRLRHGVRAVEDPALLAELAERGVVCDVTPVSNLRTGVVKSLDEHPLPAMLAAGVKCSIGSDDPVLMQTSLTEDSGVAVAPGHTPRAMYEHAVAGAFCDEPTRARLKAAGGAYDWGASCRYLESAPTGRQAAESAAGRKGHRTETNPPPEGHVARSSPRHSHGPALSRLRAGGVSPAAGGRWRSSARRSSLPGPTSSAFAAASSSRSGRLWSPRWHSQLPSRRSRGLRSHGGQLPRHRDPRRPGGRPVRAPEAAPGSGRGRGRAGAQAARRQRGPVPAALRDERRPRLPARPRRGRRAHAVPRRQRRDLRPPRLHARGASRADAARDRRGAGAGPTAAHDGRTCCETAPCTTRACAARATASSSRWRSAPA